MPVVASFAPAKAALAVFFCFTTLHVSWLCPTPCQSGGRWQEALLPSAQACTGWEATIGLVLNSHATELRISGHDGSLS